MRHFCQARLLALRMLHAALALVVSHGPNADQRFCSFANRAIHRAKMPLNPERSEFDSHSGRMPAVVMLFWVRRAARLASW